MTCGERRRRPRRQQPREVERLLHLVLTDEAGHRLRCLGPRLGDGHPVARVLREHLVPAPVDVVELRLVPHRLVDAAPARPSTSAAVAAGAVLDGFGPDLVPQALLLHQPVRDVDPEAVDAAVEPEAQDVDEHVADLGVAPVEVGLRGVEEVQVPLAVRDARPRVATEDRRPVVRRLGAVRSATLAEQVAGPLGAARPGGEGGAEPLVLAGGVVGHQVDDHLQPELVGRGEQVVRVGQRAEQRVDVAVVRHVVPVVVLRGRVERRDPQRVDPQVAQVGQP